MEKAKVYFTKELTPEKVLEMYRLLGKELPGRVACKVHSGEDGNQNYLRPEFWKPMIDAVKGTVVECNTAYPGERDTTDKHKKLIKDHKWDSYFDVDIMDASEEVSLPIENGKQLDEDIVGKDLLNYDSMLVLSHFKGHPMGGFGGALKQLSIGCASSNGKTNIHSGGARKKGNNIMTDGSFDTPQDIFLESMADAAGAVVRHFNGNIAFINVAKNLSVDCDCVGDGQAADPCMEDIGIFVSLDPVAIDQACIDMVKASDDPGKETFMERVNSRHGTHTIDTAYELGVGNKEYELIVID
ncbi:MAG: DUF362 domain-containing protein [Erysipelotrichaceae bacterium]|nr:DUF362 domain-containing protein [Erysipelotrichaceae bacterium]